MLEEGATKKAYTLFDRIIKTGSKIAINISENIIKTLTQHPNINNPSAFMKKIWKILPFLCKSSVDGRKGS